MERGVLVVTSLPSKAVPPLGYAMPRRANWTSKLKVSNKEYRGGESGHGE